MSARVQESIVRLFDDYRFPENGWDSMICQGCSYSTRSRRLLLGHYKRWHRRRFEHWVEERKAERDAIDQAIRNIREDDDDMGNYNNFVLVEENSQDQTTEAVIAAKLIQLSKDLAQGAVSASEYLKEAQKWQATLVELTSK